MSEISWTGTPVFYHASRCNDDSGRVFHRDIPGEIVAVFHGPDGFRNAKAFCELVGEKGSCKQQTKDSGDKRAQN